MLGNFSKIYTYAAASTKSRTNERSWDGLAVSERVAAGYILKNFSCPSNVYERGYFVLKQASNVCVRKFAYYLFGRRLATNRRTLCLWFVLLATKSLVGLLKTIGTGRYIMDAQKDFFLCKWQSTVIVAIARRESNHCW